METTFNTEFIDSNIENQPYLDPFARGALEIWFEKNDSIKPVFEDRLEWEKREEILEMSDDENTNNKCTLYLPKDLNLFEGTLERPLKGGLFFVLILPMGCFSLYSSNCILSLIVTRKSI